MYLKLPEAVDVPSSYKVSQVMRSATPSSHMVIAPVVKNLIRRIRRKSPVQMRRKYLQSWWTKAFSSTLSARNLTDCAPIEHVTHIPQCTETKKGSVAK